MSENTIYISVGGEKYTNWLSAQINTSVETLSSSFVLTITDKEIQKNNSDWPVRPQDECSIYIGNDKIITGYVDDMFVSIGKDFHIIRIVGRDKTSDLVDCNYIGKPDSWNSTTLLAVAKALSSPFNIKASLSSNTDASNKFHLNVNTNNTVFENLNKIAKHIGVLILTDIEGNLLITNAGDEKIENDSLEYGRNIIECSCNYSYYDRFSEYYLQAQSPNKLTKGSWNTNLKINASTVDEGIKRYRPILIKSGRPLTSETAKKAIDWEANIRAAQSQEVTITVQGFRDNNNELWKVNKLIDVYAPPLYINQSKELLITNVSYILDSNGSYTKMILKRKDAYISNPLKPKATKDFGFDDLEQKKRGNVDALTLLSELS